MRSLYDVDLSLPSNREGIDKRYEVIENEINEILRIIHCTMDESHITFKDTYFNKHFSLSRFQRGFNKAHHRWLNLVLHTSYPVLGRRIEALDKPLSGMLLIMFNFRKQKHNYNKDKQCPACTREHVLTRLRPRPHRAAKLKMLL